MMVRLKNIIVQGAGCLLICLAAFPCYAATNQSYQYDDNGNLINGDGKYFEYNDANKLVRVRLEDNTGPILAEYVYDHSGQRIKKIENGITTYYIGKHFERQEDLEGTHEDTRYYFANKTRVAKEKSDGEKLFYHTDHLGSTRAITDTGKAIQDRMQFYPFGDMRTNGQESYAFTGKGKDLKTGHYYYEARHYGINLRKFTQVDTKGPKVIDPQNLNKYVYVNNNPIKYNDPSGNEKVIVLNDREGASGAGHEAILIERDGKYYYFSKTYRDKTKMVTGSVTRREIEIFKSYKDALRALTIKKDHKYDEIYIINVSKKNADKMWSYASDKGRVLDDKYRLFTNNCKDYVRDTLSAGGIKTKNRQRPNEYMKNLAQSGYYSEEANYYAEGAQGSGGSGVSW